MVGKAFVGLGFLLGVLAAALFGSAGTLDYWQAWAFLATFGAATTAITLYLALHDPALLARRVAPGPFAERQRMQQVIQTTASIAFLAIFVVAGLDRRHGWSAVPVVATITGDVVVAAGLGVVALVFRANTYTSATIAVEREQRVVSTGPYAVVRHPMYAGVVLMMVGVPPALGSWWVAPAIAPLIAVIVWRLLDEERLLVRDLDGYAAYRATVRHRLVPFVW